MFNASHAMGNNVPARSPMQGRFPLVLRRTLKKIMVVAALLLPLAAAAETIKLAPKKAANKTLGFFIILFLILKEQEYAW